MSFRKELTLVLPLLWLLVLLPFWQLAVGQGVVITNDVGVSDIAHLQYPLRYFAGQQLRQGRLPLWTPGVYMGYPLLAEGQAGVFSPVNLILFGLLPVPYALNIGSLLPFIIAATGAYLLARELGARVAGGFLAGFSYAMSGFYIAHVKHIPIVATACWSPIALWLIERGIKRSDRAILGAGLVIGVQWLSGSPHLAYYSTGMAALYFAGRAWQNRQRRPLRRTFPLFGLALALSFGLAAVQLLPTYQLVGFSERAGGVNYDFATRFPYAVENLKTFLYPLANGTPGTGDLRVSSIFWEDYAYLGLIPLFLGLVGGLALAWRSGVARFLMGLAGATFLVVLGPNTPIFRLVYKIVPGLGFFRFPQRLWAFVLLFLTVLAGLALTRLQVWLEERMERAGQKKDEPKTWPRLLTAGLLLVTIIDLYVYQLPWNAIVDADTWLEPPATAKAVEERAGSALYRVYTHDAYETFRAAYREAGGWRGDLGPYVSQREFLQPSLNLIYDVPTADGYINLVPDCLSAVWGTEKQKGVMDGALVQAGESLLARDGFMKLMGLYNVRFLITAQPVRDEALELVGVYGPGAHLYENRQTMPRAFAVPSYLAVDTDTEANGAHSATLRDANAAPYNPLKDAETARTVLALMRSPAFDPKETVALFDSPGGPSSSPEGFDSEVNVLNYEPNSVTIEAELSDPGWLVLSDTYYPGWEAKVDGQPTPIFQANGCVRAVPIGTAGRHEVLFRFRPEPFYRGALISGVSAVVWLAVWGVAAVWGRQ